MNTYQHFALLYDELMTDVPYDKWIVFIEQMMGKYGNESKHILDLGCGTGSISIPLASKGYTVTGIDLSEDMLTVAQAKAIQRGVNVTFYQQDMRELSNFSCFDVIGIFCDSLNYLKNEEEVQKTFQNVYNQLVPNGLFLFDVHSIYKVTEKFLGHTYSSNDENISFIWNCYEDVLKDSVEHELTFFVKQNDHLYKRFDEVHVQRTFAVELYKKWLEQAGFQILEITADFSNLPPVDTSERIFFAAKK